MSTDTLARLQAEARAQAAVAEAKARADSMATNAGASAEELVVKVNRYMHDMAIQTRSMTAIPMPSNVEMIEPEHTDGARPPQIDPDHFLKSVSVHAYYKAEQRGFLPGREIDDWLEAEKEILWISPCSKDEPES